MRRTWNDDSVWAVAGVASFVKRQRQWDEVIRTWVSKHVCDSRRAAGNENRLNKLVSLLWNRCEDVTNQTPPKKVIFVLSKKKSLLFIPQWQNSQYESLRCTKAATRGTIRYVKHHMLILSLLWAKYHDNIELQVASNALVLAACWQVKSKTKTLT